MKQLRWLVCVLLTACSAFGANHYVRPGAGGSGADWSDALSALPSSPTRLDTYYLADGTNSDWTFLTPNSGTDMVYIRKATIADHGTSTGWSDTYGDGQAVFEGGIDAYEGRGYLSIDGVTNWGILLTAGVRAQGFDSRASSGVSVNTIRLNHVEVAGPGGSAPFYYDYNDDCHGIYICYFSGGTANNISISNCYVHGWSTVIQSAGWVNGVIDSCVIADSYIDYGPGGYDPDRPHCNIFFMQSDNGLLFRNNITSNYNSIGYYPSGGCSGRHVIANNYFARNSQAGGSAPIWFHGTITSGDGTWVINNNTFRDADGSNCIHGDPGSDPVGGVTNNIFYNSSGFRWASLEHDNNWYSDGNTQSENSGVDGSGINPFVTNNAPDIVTNALGGYPADAGMDLGSEFAPDFYGTNRVAPWDIGAVEATTNAPPPDTTKPLIQFAEIDETGTNLILHLDEVVYGGTDNGDTLTLGMTLGPVVPTGSQFSSSHVIYTLDRTNFAAEVVTNGLDYTAAADSLQDAAGNKVDSTNGITVVNNSTNGLTMPPRFNIKPGAYLTAQYVQLLETTPGSRIYYTTDGSAPDTNDTLYTTPFSLANQRIKINAMAATNGYVDSAATNGLFEVSVWYNQASEDWKSVLLAPKTTTFPFSFDVTYTNGTTDCIFGFGPTNIGAPTDLAVAMLFETDGLIKARNGTVWENLDTSLNYTNGGSKFSFSGTINPATHQWSAALSIDGGAPITMADNAAFRDSQATVSTLSYFGMHNYQNNWLVFDNFSTLIAESAPQHITVLSLPPQLGGVIGRQPPSFVGPELYWEPTTEEVSFNGAPGVDYPTYFAAHDDATNTSIDFNGTAITLFLATNVLSISNINANFCTSLTTLGLTKLRNISYLGIRQTALTSFAPPVLDNIVAQIDGRECSSLTSVVIPATNCSGAIDFAAANLSAGIYLDQLLNVDDYISIEASSAPFYSSSNLVFIWGDGLFMNSCASLTNVNLSSLTDVGLVNIGNDTSLSGFAIPSAVSLGNLSAHNATALSSLNVNGAIVLFSFTDPCTVDFFGCALDETSVNNLMIGIGNDEPHNDTVDVSGGSNATPTGTGFTAYSTMTNNGCSISINP